METSLLRLLPILLTNLPPNLLDALTALQRQLESGDISSVVSIRVGTNSVPNLLDTLTALAYADSYALLEQAVLGCCR